MIACHFCEKQYPLKRARDLHEKSHTDNREYYCEFKQEDGSICGQVCVSPNHLKQHHRGMHGDGWVSPCGIRFAWPATMYIHKKECTPCSNAKSAKL